LYRKNNWGLNKGKLVIIIDLGFNEEVAKLSFATSKLELK
jgi:hypothetical protein